MEGPAEKVNHRIYFQCAGLTNVMFQEAAPPPKKGSLDTLSREELIAKCKGLVGTLLKAKQEKEGNTPAAIPSVDVTITASHSRYGGQKAGT